MLPLANRIFYQAQGRLRHVTFDWNRNALVRCERYEPDGGEPLTIGQERFTVKRQTLYWVTTAIMDGTLLAPLLSGSVNSIGCSPPGWAACATHALSVWGLSPVALICCEHGVMARGDVIATTMPTSNSTPGDSPPQEITPSTHRQVTDNMKSRATRIMSASPQRDWLSMWQCHAGLSMFKNCTSIVHDGARGKILQKFFEGSLHHLQMD